MCIYKSALPLWHTFPNSSTGGVWILNGVAQFLWEVSVFYGEGDGIRLDGMEFHGIGFDGRERDMGWDLMGRREGMGLDLMGGGWDEEDSIHFLKK